MNFTETESIRKFYDGAEVFITGGSGYIGKVLVEKLLRSCSRIKTIYLLMRPKRDVTAQERIQMLTSSMMFDILKEQDIESLNKLQVIEGDATKLLLGISDSDKEKLKSCSVIFHAAASVRFDDPLRSAILMNTRATREVCEIAKTMPNLKALVHVSTAYIQPKKFYVKEQIYEPDADWRTYIDYAENLDEDYLNILSNKLTRFAPNTYTFTKHMAEHVCLDYKNNFNLPIAIFRPSIVSTSEVEPIPGWNDNLNGPMGLTLVGALALTHVMKLDGKHYLDVVPVDICVKGMILSAFKTFKDRRALKIDASLDIEVYNATSIKLVTYDSLIDEMPRMTRETPSLKLFGIPDYTFTKCTYYAWLLRIFRNILPSLIFDGILMATGNKPKLMKVQRLIYNGEVSLEHFYSHNFKFDNFNFIDLNLLVPTHEKEDFSIAERCSLNRDLYTLTYKMSLRTVFGETEQDTEAARRRAPYIYFIVRAVHLTFAMTTMKLLHGLVMKFV